MQMYYKSCVHSRTIKVHELLCCINGYAMRIERKKFEFEDTIVWVFVMHSSVEMVTKRLYLQIGAQKKARFFSLMYFCESLCINRISHNCVIPQLVFCIIMPFRTSFHIPFRKLIPPFTLTVFRSDIFWKLFDIGFPYKHCYFKPVCLPVKMASKTVRRPIKLNKSRIKS